MTNQGNNTLVLHLHSPLSLVDDLFSENNPYFIGGFTEQQQLLLGCWVGWQKKWWVLIETKQEMCDPHFPIQNTGVGKKQNSFVWFSLSA